MPVHELAMGTDFFYTANDIPRDRLLKKNYPRRKKETNE